jgi:hypothetical protein
MRCGTPAQVLDQTVRLTMRAITLSPGGEYSHNLVNLGGALSAHKDEAFVRLIGNRFDQDRPHFSPGKLLFGVLGVLRGY